MSMRPNAPIIIKRKKIVGGDGHHGGAWKVAYADFVTAMMAFFMLMWLLNATTEKQRKGIADYFSPTIPVHRVSGGGDGSFGGDSVFTEESFAQNGTGARSDETANSGATGGEAANPASDEFALSEVQDLLAGSGGESMFSDNELRHIVTRVSDEGLVIEIFDLEGAPIFAGGTPTPILSEIVAGLVEAFSLVKNDLAVAAHTQSNPIILVDNPVWDISTQRAQSLRELVEAEGFDPQRFQRVTGYADRVLAVGNPMDIRNNRVELILLRE